MGFEAACFVSVDYGDGAFLCEQTTDCQPGFVCKANHCAAPNPVDAGVGAYQRQLSIQGLMEPIANLPVLVRLNSSRIRYQQAGPNGRDLAFFGSSGIRLAHEIESWNPTGESIVWVKLPTADDSTTFDMRVGTETIPVTDDANVVWADYQLVYHFAQITSQTSHDSSPAQKVGILEGGAHVVAGRIDTGCGFDGVDDAILLASDSRLLADSNGVTLSGWAQSSNEGGSLIEMSIAGSNVSRAYLATNSMSITFGLRPQDNPMPVFATATDTPLEKDSWHWLAATADLAAGALRIYVDGTQVIETTGLTIDPPRTPDTPNQLAYIGRNEGAANSFFNGQLDEIRVSGQVSSAARIQAQYLSMTDALLTFGPEQPLP